MAIAAAVTLAACGSGGGSSGGSASAGSYVIGVEIDQSGVSRSVGVPQMQGIKAAVDGINKRGGIDGHKIKLIVRDDGSDPARAVTVYRELTGQDHVSAITGLIESVSVPPLAPLAEKDKTALLVTGAPATLLEPPSPAVFSTVANPNAQGRAGLDYIKRTAGSGSLPASPRVALLYYASPAGQAWVKEVQTYAAKIGLQVVAAENSTIGAASLNSQMQAIAAAKPDAILAFDIEADIINAAKAGKSVGLPTSTTIVNYSYASSPSTLKAVADQGYTNYATTASFDVPGSKTDSAVVKQFETDAKADGYEPTAIQLPEGYAQGLIIAEVLKKCGYPCAAPKFLQSVIGLRTDLNGFAFGPVAYSANSHEGPTAVRLRQWDPSADVFKYQGGPVPLVFTSGS